MSLDPHLIALPLVGYFAKRATDAATARAAAEAGALIRSGGNAAAMRTPPTAFQQLGAGVPKLMANLSLGALYAPPDAR